MPTIDLTSPLYAALLVFVFAAIGAFAAAKFVEVAKLTKSKVAADTWATLLSLGDSVVRWVAQAASNGEIADDARAKKHAAMQAILAEAAKFGIKIDEGTADKLIEAAYNKFKEGLEKLLPAVVEPV